MIVELPTSKIYTRPDARKLDKNTVRAIAGSISEIGLLNPLRVRNAKRFINGVRADAYEVTTGAHRLDAVMGLGWETVPCIVVDDDDLHAELAMIDENLMRAELVPAQRAKQTARRKAIYVELHPETAQGANQGEHGRFAPSRQNGDTAQRFTADTASATGKSERTVQRDAERGENIAEDVLDKVSNTKLDTGAYLDTLKKLTEDKQRAKVERDLARPIEKPVKPAPAPLNDFETEQQWLTAIMRVWNRGAPEWRERFFEHVDRPTFDKTRSGEAA